MSTDPVHCELLMMPFGPLNDTLAEALAITIFEKLQSEIVVISTHKPDKIVVAINQVFEIKEGKLVERLCKKGSE